MAPPDGDSVLRDVRGFNLRRCDSRSRSQVPTGVITFESEFGGCCMVLRWQRIGGALADANRPLEQRHPGSTTAVPLGSRYVRCWDSAQ
jgi:hypothetical protein